MFTKFDTTRAAGCYVTFERIEEHDTDANPNDYLFQDDYYRDDDQARLDAWSNDDWHFIGIRAVAHIELVSPDGTGTAYSLTSPGLWSIESDSGEGYLAGVFADECATLKADIAAMQAPIYS